MLNPTPASEHSITVKMQQSNSDLCNVGIDKRGVIQDNARGLRRHDAGENVSTAIELSTMLLCHPPCCRTLPLHITLLGLT